MSMINESPVSIVFSEYINVKAGGNSLLNFCKMDE